jgi:hypothetical protein
LEIEVTETAKDVFYAKVVGKVADGNTITIRLEPGADNITNLRIKASRFGNEEAGKNWASSTNIQLQGSRVFRC